jgi:hypothetical protein
MTCVRRVVAIALGHNLGEKVATYKCGNHKCCNPAHLTVMTNNELAKRSTKIKINYAHPLRRHRVAAARRAKSKLDFERVRAIREDPRTQREIAAEHGITQQTVSLIKRGEMWRDYTDVFGFIGMQVTA